MIPNLPPRLTPDEQAAVTRRMVQARDAIKAGDDSAETEREFLGARNALALDVCGRQSIRMAYTNPSPAAWTDDCVHETFLSALEAAERFDPVRSAKPSTMLFWWMKSGLYLHLKRQYRQTDRMASGFEFDGIADGRVEPGIEDREETAKAVEALNSLPPHEAFILRCRFGVGGAKVLTLEAIGKRLFICKERVRQLERQALRRLKERLAS